MLMFELKTKLYSGSGEFLNLAKHIKELGSSPLIIIDAHAYQHSYISTVVDSLKKEEGIKYVKIFTYDYGEPSYDLLSQHRNISDCHDCVVAIGGGSVIDFAKGIAFLETNPGPPLSYRGFPDICSPPLPLIAVPSVAGTASEVTYNAVFIDKRSKKKLGINSRLNYPAIAIHDPCVTMTAPKSVTINSAVDALVHASESLVCKQSTPLTRVFSNAALEKILVALGDISTNDENKETYSTLLLGSYLAGIGLMNSGSGIAGGLSYVLGVHCNIPHGTAGGIFLPHIIKYNEEHDIWYGKRLHLHKPIFSLFKQLKVPTDLKQYTVPKSVFDDIENLQGAFDQNPIPYTTKQAKELVEALL